MSHPNVNIKNQAKFCDKLTPTEGLRVITVGEGAATAPVAITTEDVFFQKGWFYGYKAVNATTKKLTANGANVFIGKSADYVPDSIAPGEVLEISLPLGQVFNLKNINIQGAAGDGIFYSLT